MYSIQEVSKLTGVAPGNLRFYEKVGLLPGIERTSGGIRRYSDIDVERLKLVLCLKNTGMSIEKIASFIKLTNEGDQTLEDRVNLLRTHKEQVEKKLQEMQDYLNKVTWKISFFSEKLQKYENTSHE